MELLRGTTLAHWLMEHGRPAPDQMVTIARQIAAGLAAAHAVRVIHKDLKSENVFLTLAGPNAWRATVTDFGLAAAHDLVDAVSHPVVRFSGTPGYVAPERLAGAAATTASDVFALGVVLVDLLSGSLAMRRSAEPALPRALAELHALARRCRAPRPEARPTLNEIVAALDRLAGRSGRARPGARRLVWAASVGAAALIAIAALVRVGADRRERVAVGTFAPLARAAVVATRPQAPKPTAVPVPSPAAISGPGPAPGPVRHVPRARHSYAAAPAARPTAISEPAAVVRVNVVNEPIRTLIPARQSRQRDDAPIDSLPHAP
jgi:serine/threonine-protein kinase